MAILQSTEVSGSLSISGSLTAQSFVGDGSSITGVTAETPAGTVSGSAQVVALLGSHTGTVGIGTASPTHILDITTNRTGNGQGSTLRINRPNNSSYENAINWATGGTNKWFLGSDNDSTENFYLYNWAQGSFALTVQSSNSNVGIGTTSPNAVLEIEDGGTSNTQIVKITADDANPYGLVIGNDTFTTTDYEGLGFIVSNDGIGTIDARGTNTQFRIRTGATPTERLRINTSGSVGIGTTTVEKTFTVEFSNEDTTVTTGNGLAGGAEGDGVKIQNNSTTSGTYANLDFRANNADGRIAYKYMGTTNVGDFHFITDNLNSPISAMIIKNDGKVSIGGATPSAKLHVKGEGGVSGLTFKTTDASDNETFFILDGGRTGVRYYPLTVGIPSSTAAATNAVFQVEEAGLLTVLTGGNVGIGTTSPDSKLHIVDGNNYIKIGDLNGVSTAVIELSDSSPVQIEGYSSDLRFNTNGSPRMTINNAGNVGIGETSVDARLHVTALASSGISNIKLESPGASKWAFGIPASQTYLAFDETNDNLSTPTMVLTKTTKRVGIGTTSPAALLQIDTPSANNAGQGLRLNRPAAGTHYNSVEFATNGTVDWSIGQNSNDAFEVYENGAGATTRFTIKEGGNVGIGTTSPGAKLHVDGDVIRTVNSTWSGIESHNTNGTWESFVGTESGGGGNRYNAASSQHTFYNNSSAVMRINSSGNVGIGTTSPSATLHLSDASNSSVTTFSANGRITMRGDGVLAWGASANQAHLTWATGYAIVHALSGQKLYLGAGGSTDNIVIDTSGNVGIGTTSPSRTLHVDGGSGVAARFETTSDSTIELVSTNSWVGINFNDSSSTNENIWYNGGQGTFAIGGGGSNVSGKKLHIDGGVSIGSNSDALSVPTDGLYVEGDLTVGGIVTAQEFHTEFVSASIVYSSGSTKFGDTSDDVHAFTGSINLFNPTSTTGTTGTTLQTLTNYVGSDLSQQKTFIDFIFKDDNANYTPQVRIGAEVGENGDANAISKESSGAFIVYTSEGTDEVGSGTISEKFRVDYKGNVGIGTTSPDTKTHISHTTRINDAYGLLLVENTNTTSGNSATNSGINVKNYHGTSQFMQWEDNGVRIGSRITANSGLGNVYFTGGSDSVKMFINGSNGNVGIGTTSPDSKLHVSSGDIRITNNSPSIYFYDSDVSGLYHRILGGGNKGLEYSVDPNNATAGYHRWDIGGTVVAQLIEGGNFGLGTTTPSYKLTINTSDEDHIRLENGSEVGVIQLLDNGILNFWSHGDDANNEITFSNGTGSGTERMRIDSSGNVGIGTSSPGLKLDVNGDIRLLGTGTGNNSHILYFTNSAAAIARDANNLELHAYDNLIFGVSNTAYPTSTERMRIDSSGNVGIGTTSPSYKLDVGDGTVNTSIRIHAGVNGSASLRLKNDAQDWDVNTQTTDTFAIYNQTSATQPFSILTNGNVGIGTATPATILNTSGSGQGITHDDSTTGKGYIRFRNGGTQLALFGVAGAWEGSSLQDTMIAAETGHNIRFYTNGTATPSMFINTASNVGIGTTSPAYKLHVEGDIGVGSNNAVTARYSTNETYKGTFRWAALQLGNNGSNRIIAGRTATGGVLDFYTNNTNDASDYTNTPDGTHVMRMAADGKVGIGTTSPNNKLEISDTGVGTGSTHLKISRGADSSAVQRIAGIKMGNTANNDGSNWIVQADSSLAYFDNANLNFIHNSAGTPSTRMTITSSGNLGIGTTAPSSKLHVEGATKVYSTIGDADNVRTGIAHYDNSAMGSHVGGQLVLGYKYDTGGTYTEGAILKMYKENGTSGQYGSGLKFQVRNHGANLSTKMILDPSGNLGIGTTTPGAKLTVVGSAISISNGWTGNHDILFVGGSPSSTGAANQTAARIRSTASAPGGAATGDLRFTVNSGDSLVDGMYISTTGNVGIGTTSPGQLLSIQSDGSYSDGAKIDLRHPNNNTTDVIAGIGFSNNTGEVAKIVAGTTNGNTNGYVSFFTDDNGTPGERVRITSSGSVGIGTSSPTAKLQVEGSGSTIFDVQGSQGQLFSVTDDLTGTLFSVNDISGIPILSVDSDDTVTMGTFGENTLVVTGSNVGIGTDSPGAKLHVTSADANTVFLLGNTGTGGVNWAMYSANNSSAQAQAGGDLLFRNASSNVLVLQNDGDVLIPSGDVGIGTASPTTRLTVYEPNGAGNGSAQEVARFANTASGATSGYLYIGASSGTDWLVGKNVLGTADGADFHITTHTSSPALTINNSTLNVGIGTTSPAWKLVVEGAGSGTGLQDGLVQLRSTTAANHSGIIFINSGNTSSFNDLASIQAIIESGDAKGALRFITRNTDGANTDVAERMRIFASGNVGINYSNGVIHTYGSGVYGGKAVIKASSDNALALLNSSTGGSAQVALNFTNEFVANQYNYLARIVAEPTQAWTSDAATRDSNLNFFTTLNGVTTERMRIDSNGQAYFKSSTDYKVGLNDSAGTNQWWLKSYTNGDFSIHENGVGDKLTIQAGGNVGIGNTSPTEKLEVAGNAILDASNANLKIKAGVGGTKGDIQWTFNSDSTVYASAGIEYDNRGSDGFLIDSGYPITLDYASSYIRFSNNGSEKMRLDTSGNLGIGTTSPGSKLHVEGTSAGAGIVLRVKNTGANGAAQLDLVNDAQSWFVNTRTDDKFSIYNNTASTTALTIDTSNNVGIGTTSPSSLLHVGGTITGLNAFIVDETTTNISLFEGYDSNNDGILIGVNSGGDPYFAPIENNTKQFSQEFLWDTSADEWVFEDDVQFNKIIKIQPAGYYVLANADTTRNSHKWQVNGTTYWDLYINANGNLEWRDSNGTQTFDVQAPLSKASGTFKIKHPDPSKNKTHFLHHSFVESPTAGDNIYRWQVEVVNGTAVVELPDYYKYLNENDQVWVSPFKHFGQAYGEVNEEQTYLTITANADGLYNVLCIGTRKDEDAVNAWTGCERLQPEPDGDLLDRDEYKDYKTNNE